MKLKIKQEHYEILRDAINKVRQLKPDMTLQFYQENNLGKDHAMRWRWDLYWAAKQLKLLPDNFICDVLYRYLDDTHIDSALRMIVK